MQSNSQLSGPIYSTLGDDPDLGELVDMFVDEMPDRANRLQHAYDAAQWDDLQRLAHQIKGAAGSYGFHQLTPLAARLETLVRDRDSAEQIAVALADLLDLCRRATAGSEH